MRITAHAVVRYLERVCGIDFGALHAEYPDEIPPEPSDKDVLRWLRFAMPGLARMVCDDIRAQCREARYANVSQIKTARCTFVLEGRTLVTVWDHGHPPQMEDRHGHLENEPDAGGPACPC